MLKEFLLFIKYPYTAGVIATMWLGTTAFLAINNELPLIKIMSINVLATIFVAYLGFRGKKEL